MEFVKLNGYISDNSSFISMEVIGASNDDCIGDQVWFNKEGTEMEIYADADQDVFDDVKEMFDISHRRAFVGAMLRMGVEV